MVLEIVMVCITQVQLVYTLDKPLDKDTSGSSETGFARCVLVGCYNAAMAGSVMMMNDTARLLRHTRIRTQREQARRGRNRSPLLLHSP